MGVMELIKGVAHLSAPRRHEEPDLGLLALEGDQRVQALNRAHARWGLDTAVYWQISQLEGTLSWVTDEVVATAPVQVIGSWSQEDGWLWAWANPTLEVPLVLAAEVTRAFGALHGMQPLTDPSFPCDEAGADDMAAIAVRITGALGYFAPLTQEGSRLYCTFGDVDLSAPDGSGSVFRVTELG